MINKVNVIHIGWEKMLYNENRIARLDKDHDYGIYQIYGAHPVYGQDTLLYIGKANKIKFAERLKSRYEFNETVLRPRCLHIGRIFKTEHTSNNWNLLVDIAERILIKAHAPAYNSMDVKGLYGNEDDVIVKNNYIIKNWYEYGLLLPEISSMSVSYKYWQDFDNSEQEKYWGEE